MVWICSVVDSCVVTKEVGVRYVSSAVDGNIFCVVTVLNVDGVSLVDEEVCAFCYIE